MELDKVSGGYCNKLGQIVDLEEELVFGLLKSSDLKHETVDSSRKVTVVTQRKIGQDTSYIQNSLPAAACLLERPREVVRGAEVFHIQGET